MTWQFIKNIFAFGSSTSQKQASESETLRYTDELMPEDATPAEIEYVAQTLKRFEELGLRRNLLCKAPIEIYANSVVAGYPDDEASLNAKPDTDISNRITLYSNFPRLSVLWVIENEETGDSLDYFRNLLVFSDHCFDVAEPRDYHELLEKILSLPGDDWRPRLIEVATPAYTLRIQNGERTDTIKITDSKDFDTTLFHKLNSLVPPNTLGRFGFIGDGGNVLVVWMSSQDFSGFNEYCGIELDSSQ